ncbi:MAG: pyridoxamine 5-phosphate oxidase-related FMN-binding protein [Actinomycetia bacterium]|nr:pyridoxamine 5-phosphate oxidase-related FMN-binding protein [Actinomycetes bacterium]
MEHAEIIELLTEDPVAQQLLRSPIPARLAYLATDGTPRAVPIIYHFDGRSFVLATPDVALKVKSLQANPNVALTIDTEGHPPIALLVRGTASITFVDGVVPEFLEANRRRIPAEEFEAFAEGVAIVFPRMARIEITPTWAKVLDDSRPPESHRPRS